MGDFRINFKNVGFFVLSLLTKSNFQHCSQNDVQWLRHTALVMTCESVNEGLPFDDYALTETKQMLGVSCRYDEKLLRLGSK